MSFYERIWLYTFLSSVPLLSNLASLVNLSRSIRVAAADRCLTFAYRHTARSDLHYFLLSDRDRGDRTRLRRRTTYPPTRNRDDAISFYGYTEMKRNFRRTRSAPRIVPARKYFRIRVRQKKHIFRAKKSYLAKLPPISLCLPSLNKYLLCIRIRARSLCVSGKKEFIFIRFILRRCNLCRTLLLENFAVVTHIGCY